MSIDFTTPPEEEVLSNPGKFIPRVITGGKGPPKSPIWLMDMEIGDIFLARHNKGANENFELNQFTVLRKFQKSVRLQIALPDDNYMVRCVDAATFSREMIFNEVIGRDPEVAE